MKIDIICTIGPSSADPSVIRELIEHGMTVARLNMSHGDHDSHLEVIQAIRQMSSVQGKKVRILGDLQGPKIRLGEVEEGKVELKEGQTFNLVANPIEGNKDQASIDYPQVLKDVKPGSRILINDGEVELKVTRTAADQVVTQVVTGGMIGSHKGVNIPGTTLSIAAMTDKDKADIEFLMHHQVDMIACSFIRKAEHLQEIRRFAEELSPHRPQFVAKMEVMEGVKNFASISVEADGIMVARGDLGVELPLPWIPVLQKAMIHECRKNNKYVITATQMLQSMVDHPIPTRAEVTDVFQAVLDGTNAVMLSAESAAGKFPVKSVDMLKLVSEFAEKIGSQQPYDLKDIMDLLSGESLKEEALLEV